ncbi:unnamed protein product [Protopolystoma xenopodis]|uniref:Uncharacterized protein n=1 Tax=Protopolystoma xenopodis TaxID=117903 RepID=A0A448WPD4_9PLAT|nr:unnamed protein product [Protopolystoma xenopodis]
MWTRPAASRRRDTGLIQNRRCNPPEHHVLQATAIPHQNQSRLTVPPGLGWIQQKDTSSPRQARCRRVVTPRPLRLLVEADRISSDLSGRQAGAGS